MIKLAIALPVLMALSVPCAAEDPYTATYSTCMDKSGGVTVEMLNCIAAETKTQDARLNKAYKELGGKLSLSRKKQLTSVQRLWVQYRDANCKFYADPDGGSIVAVTSNDCVLRQTADLARELEALIPGSSL